MAGVGGEPACRIGVQRPEPETGRAVRPDGVAVPGAGSAAATAHVTAPWSVSVRAARRVALTSSGSSFKLNRVQPPPGPGLSRMSASDSHCESAGTPGLGHHDSMAPGPRQ